MKPHERRAVELLRAKTKQEEIKDVLEKEFRLGRAMRIHTLYFAKGYLEGYSEATGESIAQTDPGYQLARVLSKLGWTPPS